MNLAAPLQIVGATLIILAAAWWSLILAVLVAGVIALAFGLWEELSS